MCGNKSVITVFTPVYNRKDLIRNLYNSLLSQTVNDFVWLIVDDGSTDGTGQVIEEFIKEEKLKIRYHYQENQGKYVAHNTGVKLCDTELFVCVDSDDVLLPFAIEKTIMAWNECRESNNICGIVSPKKIGNTSFMRNPPKISALSDLYNKGQLVGETMLVFRTKVLKEFYFPEIEGEKFMSESVVYLKIDDRYKFAVLNEYLYEAEYQENGLTNNIVKIQWNNPKSTLLMYKTIAGYQRSFIAAAKAYGSYLAWKKLKGINDFDVDIKVPILVKVAGFVLKRHYWRLFWAVEKKEKLL